MLNKAIKSIPGVRTLLRSKQGQALRHKIALHFERRENFTYTQFLRLPSQFEALAGPVLEFVRAGQRGKPIRIIVMACSSGAEPYSIASLLHSRAPDLSFSIEAWDISEEMISLATGATYPETTVRANPLVSDAFVSATFDPAGDHLIVKPHIAKRVHFQKGDMLDPAMLTSIAKSDIVFAQNVMCNMQRPIARRLFNAAVSLMKPRSVLFIDGMDIDMRITLTRAHGLVPMTFAIEQIHNEARLVRGPRYPWFATGLEPFSPARADAARRYATIFQRDCASD